MSTSHLSRWLHCSMSRSDTTSSRRLVQKPASPQLPLSVLPASALPLTAIASPFLPSPPFFLPDLCYPLSRHWLGSPTHPRVSLPSVPIPILMTAGTARGRSSHHSLFSLAGGSQEVTVLGSHLPLLPSPRAVHVCLFPLLGSRSMILL